MPFVDRWKTAFHHPCQSLFCLINLQAPELRRGGKVRAGTIVLGGLLLAFAGCGGDGGGSNVPERGRQHRWSGVNRLLGISRLPRMRIRRL
jgi:hypothetical protein